MWQKSWLLASVVALVASVGMARAQDSSEANPPPSPAEEMKPQKPTITAWSPPKDKVEFLTEELKLDPQQQDQILKILQDHQAKQRELAEAYKPSEEDEAKMRELSKAMAEAVEAKDDARIRQIQDERRVVNEKRVKEALPIHEKLMGMQEELEKNVRATLREDQREKFDDVWSDRLNPSGIRPISLPNNPAMLMKIVNHLKDLTPDQKKQTDELFRTHREATRALDRETDHAKSSAERTKLNSKLYEDVVKVLTDKQREEMSRQLRMMRRPSRFDDPKAEKKAEGSAEKPANAPTGGATGGGGTAPAPAGADTGR